LVRFSEKRFTNSMTNTDTTKIEMTMERTLARVMV
jgi:hypothetical protein